MVLVEALEKVDGNPDVPAIELLVTGKGPLK